MCNQYTIDYRIRHIAPRVDRTDADSKVDTDGDAGELANDCKGGI